MPILFPINKSINNPKTTPADIPNFLPKNNPINNKKIMNKFGFIPAILNQLKNIDCKKYKKINVINKNIVASAFFIFKPFFFLMLSFVKSART